MYDLISRQAVIEAINSEREWVDDNISDAEHHYHMKNGIARILSIVWKLPTIQPEQKTGHWWINPDGYAPYCSECKHDSRIASTYCPNCGAKMEEVK